MRAKRPGNEYSKKININPVVDRTTQATAEDYHESADIFNNHAELIDRLNGGLYNSNFVGYYSSIAVLKASVPDPEPNNFAVIRNSLGVPSQIAKVVAGVWVISYGTDGVFAGTRNILLNSKEVKFRLQDHKFKYDFTAVEAKWNTRSLEWSDNIKWSDGVPNVSQDRLEGEFVVSVDVKSAASQIVTLRLADTVVPVARGENIHPIEADRWTRVYVTVNAHFGNEKLLFEIEPSRTDVVLEYQYPKLAVGNQYDGWIPAPEDVDNKIGETREEATAAAKTYADAKTELNLLKAKAYADGEITKLEQIALNDATAKSNAARKYSDAKNQQLKILTDAYADGVVSALESQLIQQSSDNVAATEAYLNAVDYLIQVRASVNADGQITPQEQQLIDDAQAAVDSSAINADSQFVLLDTMLRAYADGIVSDAEARAIAEAKEQAAAAKAYAEAQDALLEVRVSAYADGIVSDAEARAIAEAQSLVDALSNRLDTIKSDLEGEILDINTRISTLENNTLDALADGILLQTEIADLKVQKGLLDKEKKDVDRRYALILSNQHLEGVAESNLITSEADYQADFAVLSTYYDDIFATGSIPPQDPSTLIGNYTSALADFSTKMDTALAAIAQKKADLAEAGAVIHTDTRLEQEILPAIADAQSAADALEYLATEAFWDGKLEENEAQALQTHLEPLLTEKEDLYYKFAIVYNNELLKDPEKNDLYTKYNTYETKYLALAAAIENLVVGSLTPAKKQAVNTAFEAHRNALNSLRTSFENAAIAIEQEHIDGITVGTRNILLESTDINFLWETNNSIIHKVNSDTFTWSTPNIKWSDDIRWSDGIPNTSEEDLSGEFAFGVEVKVPSTRTVTAEIRDTVAPFTIKSKDYTVPADKWTRIGVAGEGKSGNSSFVLAIKTSGVIQLDYRNPKLEHGNKWTDHNPAPEDIYLEIKTAKNEAQKAAEEFARLEAERKAIEAKAYADGKLSAAEAALLENATAKAIAARRYADARDEYVDTLTRAYADGIVTAEEQRAIAEAAANLVAAKNYAEQEATAAKAYADAQDLLLQAESNAYADGIVTAEEQARIDSATANLVAAKEYADAQDALQKVQVKAYADGIVTAEEQRAIAEAAANLVAAKNYADAQDALLQTQSNAYADGIVTAEEQARIDAAADNLVAAKNYADAQDALQEVQVKAYADGIVTAEEQRAIADAEAKLLAAKNYAESQDAIQKTQIDALETNVENFQNTIDTAIIDPAISEAELSSIKKHKNAIVAQQHSIYANYAIIYTSEFLFGAPKTNLAASYATYDAAYDDLVQVITTAVANNYVTPLESATIDTHFEDYTLAIADLGMKLEAAKQFIDTEKDNKYTNTMTEQEKIDLQQLTQALEDKTNFLDPQIRGSAVMAGTFAFGNSTGGLGGLTGVLDKGDKSALLWLGESFANRYAAPFRVLGDGSAFMTNASMKSSAPGQGSIFFNNGALEFYDDQNRLRKRIRNGIDTSFDNNERKRMEQGVSDQGVPVFNFYDEQEILKLVWSDSGIRYIGYIQSSWASEDLYLLTPLAIASNSTLEQAFRDKLKKELVSSNPMQVYQCYITGPTTYHRYNAGVNMNSDQYKQYEKFYYKTKWQTAPNQDYIADGWYCRKYGTIVYYNVGGPMDDSNDGLIVDTFEAFRISNGERIDSSARTISFTQMITSVPSTTF